MSQRVSHKQDSAHFVQRTGRPVRELGVAQTRGRSLHGSRTHTKGYIRDSTSYYILQDVENATVLLQQRLSFKPHTMVLHV